MLPRDTEFHEDTSLTQPVSEPAKKKKKTVLVFHKVGNFALFLHLVATEAASASNCHISLLQLVTHVTTSRVKFANLFPSNIVAPFPK